MLGVKSINPKYKAMLTFSSWGFSNPSLTSTNVDNGPQAVSGPFSQWLAWPGVEICSHAGSREPLRGLLKVVPTLRLAIANLMEVSIQVTFSQKSILSTQISQLYVDL